MTRNRPNPILARLQGICFNTPDSPGGDAGGGGGGGGGSTPAPAPSTPAVETPPANGGGQVQQDANHVFGRQGQPQGRTERVVSTLSKAEKDRNYTLSSEEVADLLSFDLDFQPQTNQPAAQQPKPAAQTPQAPNAQQTPQAPQAPQAPQLSPDVQALVQALRESGVGQPQAPQNPQTPKPALPKPYYGGEVGALDVHDNVVAQLLGTDDAAIIAGAKPALNTLLNGLANRVMQDAQARTVALLAAYAQRVPDVVRQQHEVTASERAFYTKFPELNKPVFKSAVDAVAGVVITHMKKRNPNFKLDDKTIDLIGTKAHEKIARDLGFAIPRGAQTIVNAPPRQQQQQQPQQQQQQTQAREPFMSSGAGARPPAAGSGNQSADVLSFVM